MEKIIEALSNIKQVKGVLIIDRDGLVISSAGQMKNDPDLIGASVSELYSAAESMSKEKLESGKTVRLSLETDSSRFVMAEVTDDTILVIVCEQGCNVGLIYKESQAAAEKLKSMLS